MASNAALISAQSPDSTASKKRSTTSGIVTFSCFAIARMMSRRERANCFNWPGRFPRQWRAAQAWNFQIEMEGAGCGSTSYRRDWTQTIDLAWKAARVWRPHDVAAKEAEPARLRARRGLTKSGVSWLCSWRCNHSTIETPPSASLCTRTRGSNQPFFRFFSFVAQRSITFEPNTANEFTHLSAKSRDVAMRLWLNARVPLPNTVGRRATPLHDPQSLKAKDYQREGRPQFPGLPILSAIQFGHRMSDNK